MATQPCAPAPDPALIERTRRGDSAAFADLWSRHAPAGHRYARRFTSTFDPDDLVSEAFLQILRAIRNGQGPTSEFRPYLFATIRNQARSWGRSLHDVAVDDLDLMEAEGGDASESVVRAWDAQATALAFRSLPPRWRRVIWLLEVERLSPPSVARIMQITPNNVSSLAFRAREALRDAWIQLQVRERPAAHECEWCRHHLGAYAGHHLSPTQLSRMTDHLASCASCASIAQETLDTASMLLSRTASHERERLSRVTPVSA